MLPFVIAGLATGSLYGMAALGLVLTYRTSGVFNFGHGALAAGASFLFYTLHVTHHVPWPIAGLITLVLFASVVAFVMDRITRSLRDVPPAVAVMATIGILLAIQGLLSVIYGPVSRNFPGFLPASGFSLFGVNVSWAQVISAAVAAGAALSLYWFLRRARLGVAMRAVVDNAELASLAGERPNRVRMGAWAIGCVFAAASGILLAPTLNLDAPLLTFLVVQAFGAAAIGRFSSLLGTYVGGLAVGVLASVATKYFTSQPWNGLPAAVPFLLLVGVLLIVPVSRFPQPRVSLRATVEEAKRLSRRSAATLLIVGGVALLLVPAVVGTHLPLWTNALAYVIIFGSLSLLVWLSGQMSLGHASLVAVGVTTMSHQGGLPWPVALVLAGLAAVPVGALMAIPAIRLSGIYLALATLGFGILMQYVAYGTFLMFGSGFASARRPELGIVDGTNDTWLYYIFLLVMVICGVILIGIAKSRLGRLLRGIAEAPTMLSTLGLGVTMTRVIVYGISAFLAGIGGALLVTQSGTANGASFGPFQSLLLLAVLAISGTRLLGSAIVAAALFAVLPGYLPSIGLDQQTLVFGVGLIVSALIIARRSELAGWFARQARGAEGRPHGPVRGRADTFDGHLERPGTQVLANR